MIKLNYIYISLIAIVVSLMALSCDEYFDIEPNAKNQEFTVNGVSFEMVFVEGGSFIMGATFEQGGDAEGDEKPTHQVTLSDYMIGETEVTQELWQAVMGSNPSEFNGNDLPVENVSWNDCQEFIDKLNIATKGVRPKGMVFRLPTEAEWEYAARGGNKSKGYKYSGSNDIGSVAWYTSTTNDSGTKPVATKAPNELGLYDMSGNVWEWCSDWYGDYSSGSQTNPKGPSSGSSSVSRGGSWNDLARYCRVSDRDNYIPDIRNYYLGLRLAFAEGVEPEFEYKTYTVNGVSFEMVEVKGGTFTMGATSEQGSDAFSDELPTHQVTLSDYMIGKTEVTQELWQAVMGSNPSYYSGNNLPVEQVSWYDCQEFIKKLNSLTGLNFRLPTEAEWEYAARGGNKSKGYKYSGSNDIGNVAWYSGNSSSQTHAVATKSANELGLYDMSGNILEWCSDWYGSYSIGSQTNPKGPSTGSARVFRGGGWATYARDCRVSSHISIIPDCRGSDLGLRLALAEGEEPETPDEPIEPEFEYKTYTINGVSFDMVSVVGGTFTMGATLEQGSDADSDEKPTHNVTLSDYMIAKTEVTQELWQAVMGSNPSSFKGDNLPVEQVSWDDCQEFIEKLNIATKDIRPKGLVFQLPTEAEWEYAARGGNKSKGYKYSGSNDIGSVAWYYDNSSFQTHAVATKSANELGLYDMSGNVWEWCSDWYGDYSSGSQTNPKGSSSGSYRVFRGGSWNSGVGGCRVSIRDNGSLGYRYYDLGLRLALAEGEEPKIPDEPTEPEFEYKTYTVKGISFDMVSVVGGTFTMGAGSNAASNEMPTHKVTLSDYMIGKNEVTQELWQAVMGSNPSYHGGNNLPVEKVSWNDCQEFIKKLNSLTGLNFRLPTEAEWEYAARGGNKSKGYKYSGSNDIGSVAWYWYYSNSPSRTHEVATKAPNELGIYDMSGNVDEWCSDWYGNYSSGSQTNPKGPTSGSHRVSRGGGCNRSAWYCRVSFRDYINPDFMYASLGLRLAL